MQEGTIRFSDIPGQSAAAELLRGAVDGRRIPHALLLSGPQGIGKMMMARAFMAYAHCLSPRDGEPCGECRNCRLHAANAHPDVHFSYPIVKNKARNVLVSEDVKDIWLQMLREAPDMKPEHWLELIEAGNSQPQIHVEEAEELIRVASFPPYSSELKFLVIWLPERLHLSAANKLLKIIEEPGQGICFLLVSNNELEVLPTIFSRTQRVRLSPLSSQDISGYLQRRWGLDAMTAERLAPLADGSLSKAAELGSHSGENDEFRGIFQTMMRDAYAMKVGDLKQLSEKTAQFGREKIVRFLTYVSGMIRENFIYNLQVPQLNRMTQDDETFSRRFAPFIHAGNVETLFENTDRARRDIERNCNAKIVLFDYFLQTIGQIRKKPQQ